MKLSRVIAILLFNSTIDPNFEDDCLPGFDNVILIIYSEIDQYVESPASVKL